MAEADDPVEGPLSAQGGWQLRRCLGPTGQVEERRAAGPLVVDLKRAPAAGAGELAATLGSEVALVHVEGPPEAQSGRSPPEGVQRGIVFRPLTAEPLGHTFTLSGQASPRRAKTHARATATALVATSCA